MRLFTDVDLDGLGCGILAKLAFKEDANVYYCSYRNLNQRVENFLDSHDVNNTETYITDLAVNGLVEKRLEERFKKGRHIRMIDHHVTAMHFNQYQWAEVLPEYETGKKTCATSLFYDYLVEQKKLQRSGALDEFVELVRQYDTWEWDQNNNVTAKRLNDLFYILNREEFEEDLLKRLQTNSETFSLTDTENLLLDIEEQKIERYIHSKKRQLIQTFTDNDEYCVGIVHAEQYLSELGNALNKQNPHLDMILLLNAGTKKAGFRTIHDHVDVSEFAKRFGGGGHPKASGCDMTEEVFEKFVVNVFHVAPLKPDPDKNELNIKGASYGTSYVNHKGEISYIIPMQAGQFEVIHAGKKLDMVFDSFEAAEIFIKKQFASWLRFDNECLRDFSINLPRTDHEVKNQYAQALKERINSYK